MKKILHILLIVLVFACDSENAADCFQKAGTIIQNELELGVFNKILVNRDIELIVKEGAQKVVIETGENLINDVTVVVVDNQLILTDNNNCNYVRNYGITKVYVTAPDITEIRSSTQYDISSDGVLTYPNLTILSEDFNAPGTFTTGNFRLQIDNSTFRLVFNNLSNCFVSGNTNNLHVTFASGNGRFEGENLTAQNIQIWHRGTNDMLVNPIQSIQGVISSVGNVISINRPNTVNMDELYKGRLIFK